MSPLRCALVAVLALSACKRETRELRTDPPVQQALDGIRVMPVGVMGVPPRVIAVQGDPYENNAYQLSQGKRLYDWFGCKGCHANGGGFSGPALMNGWWRYGPDPVTIYASIRDGRPNGMPPFRDKLTQDQIWQLTGYVRAVGTFKKKTAYPSRNDEMQARPSENRAPAATNISIPPSR
jgi:cytochrome c oxidase cbb3-type subunit 3